MWKSGRGAIGPACMVFDRIKTALRADQGIVYAQA